MFRSGQSEYAINGDHCRLLDVQDLLSDSGLGREMHVIVGQGHLDDDPARGPGGPARPDRGGGGVLKHRKRKEKALRKLEAMQANLTRLVDLTAELSRRLKPLGRQAEVARKAAVIQAELRDARLRLLADDYVTLAAELRRDEADEAAVLAGAPPWRRELAQARARENELDQAAQQASAVLARAQETWFALSSLTERLRSTQHLAAQRHALLTDQAEPERPGRDPDELDRQADELREEEAELNERLKAGREVLSSRPPSAPRPRRELAATERRQAEGAKAAAAAGRPSGRPAARAGRRGGQPHRGRAGGDGPAGGLRDREPGSAPPGPGRYEQVQDQAGGGDEDRSELAAAHEPATATLAECTERTEVLRTAEREAGP